MTKTLKPDLASVRMLRDRHGFLYGYSEEMAKQRDLYEVVDGEGNRVNDAPKTLKATEPQPPSPDQQGVGATSVVDISEVDSSQMATHQQKPPAAPAAKSGGKRSKGSSASEEDGGGFD